MPSKNGATTHGAESTVKEGPSYRDLIAASLIAFIAAFTAAWGLFAGTSVMEMAGRTDWPAWVQAVGSVGAILVAVYVPTRISNREHQTARQKQLYQARGLAFVLLPIVLSAGAGIYSARERWKHCPLKYDDDEVTEYLVVPSALMDRLLDLHILSEAGVAIQAAIVAINSLRTGIFSQYAFWRYGGIYYDPETGEEEELMEPEDVDRLIQVAIDAVAFAESKLKHLLAE